MSEGKVGEWTCVYKSVVWTGSPCTGDSINVWMPHWASFNELTEQQERLAAWLNHIAPDGVIPPVPRSVSAALKENEV